MGVRGVMVGSRREYRSRSRSWIALAAFGLTLTTLHAHPFVPQDTRVGAFPAFPGEGWAGEAFLNLPGNAAEHLLVAEKFVQGRIPDFTFRTQWIDFPAGPVSDVADADLLTVGDLLDGYIFDVSDPAKLNEPMSHLLLRFSGLVKVTLQDESRTLGYIGPPIWLDYGSWGFDGYRTTVGGVTCYSVINSNEFESAWYNFGPSIEVQGLYPIRVTYFNNYDPDGSRGAPRGGFELYSWQGSPYFWPAANSTPPHSVFGPMTLAPPWPIYQPGDQLPMERGDFDGNATIDLHDYQWIQNCFCNDAVCFLAAGCDWVDFDLDAKINWTDADLFTKTQSGP